MRRRTRSMRRTLDSMQRACHTFGAEIRRSNTQRGDPPRRLSRRNAPLSIEETRLNYAVVSEFDHWLALARWTPLAIVTDLDGTLIPFASTPDEARPMPRLLA